MYGKISENRFTIKFSHTDPAHIQVAAILNRQERGNKAQYIVDAIMHYTNSGEARDTLRPVRLDERHIEAVVRRILSGGQANGGSGFVGADGGGVAPAPVDAAMPAPVGAAVSIVSSADNDSDTISPSQPTAEIIYSDAVEALGEDGLSAIAGALDMFRRK